MSWEGEGDGVGVGVGRGGWAGLGSWAVTMRADAADDHNFYQGEVGRGARGKGGRAEAKGGGGHQHAVPRGGQGGQS